MHYSLLVEQLCRAETAPTHPPSHAVQQQRMVWCAAVWYTKAALMHPASCNTLAQHVFTYALVIASTPAGGNNAAP